MGTQTEIKGRRGASRERRSGKDRREYIDPRYRNPAYPEFCDRRKGERRKPVYEDVQPFIKEHPIRKWIILIGIVAAFFLIYIFFFTNLIVNKKTPGEPVRKHTITIGYDKDQCVLGHLDLAQALPIRGNQKADKKT